MVSRRLIPLLLKIALIKIYECYTSEKWLFQKLKTCLYRLLRMSPLLKEFYWAKAPFFHILKPHAKAWGKCCSIKNIQCNTYPVIYDGDLRDNQHIGVLTPFRTTLIYNWISHIKCILNFQFNINCRRQTKFNLWDWWIMHQHYIGLPPATNSYPIELVSGNCLNLNCRR